MNMHDSRISLFRPVVNLFHHNANTNQIQGVTTTVTTPTPINVMPATAVNAVAPAPAPVAAPVAAHSNLGISILNDALAAGMIAISLFVKNPSTQQHAASLITAFAPLIGMIESQLGFTTNTPAA